MEMKDGRVVIDLVDGDGTWKMVERDGRWWREMGDG